MIPLPRKPKVVEEGKNKATFVIEGLYPGYGITIGNSFRRILLSSLEGAAVTMVKIKDVPHEFTTIPGVLEDVILILLNLKKLRFKVFTSEPQKAVLKAKGKRKISAADFKIPSQVEIINKDQLVATLTSKSSSLEMEIQIKKGIGYESTERREEKSPEIGTIELDAIYTPIKKVSFQVEDMRVGKRTDFDRLTLRIETDGTILPQEAFEQARQILIEHFSSLSIESKKKKVRKEKEKEKKKEIDVEKLSLSSRTISILQKNRVKTVAGLVLKTKEDILTMEGLGPKSLEEIEKALKKISLSLKSN